MRSLKVKTVLFQAFPFIIGTQLSSIWSMDRTLSAATSPGFGNDGVHSIPQSSRVIGTLPSDCLVSHPGHSLRESYPFVVNSRYILLPQPTRQNFKSVLTVIHNDSKILKIILFFFFFFGCFHKWRKNLISVIILLPDSAHCIYSMYIVVKSVMAIDINNSRIEKF